MRFAALAYAHLLGLVPALLALYIYAFARKRQALAEFLDIVLTPRLVPTLSRVRQWCKAVCLIGALGGLVLALMQPQWGQEWQEVQRQGRDILIVLDVSRSMLAEAVVPNRLAPAKNHLKHRAN